MSDELSKGLRIELDSIKARAIQGILKLSAGNHVGLHHEIEWGETIPGNRPRQIVEIDNEHIYVYHPLYPHPEKKIPFTDVPTFKLIQILESLEKEQEEIDDLFSSPPEKG